MTELFPYIKSRAKLPEISIKDTVELLNEDATIPFISATAKSELAISMKFKLAKL